MKNFKRVISAVIALALSASTLVAVSAAKFTDVDDTNSYAKAIESLAALDIVSGYEDGSFNPDGDITRAEAARMIVSALNMNADAAASAGDTQFADVNESASWAKGFVNVGVAQGYIHGYNETSFGPQDKVTFAQMCVMLTTITGYGDYAAANGGYPQGYIAMASTAGINKGVALAAETPLKRGQVAQMVYNGVTAPMLDVSTYKFDGNEYGKMDGTNYKTKKTLLSDRFDAIEVRATVNSFSGGKASLKVTDSYNYGTAGYEADVYKKVFVSGTTVNSVIVENDIDLSSHIQQDVKAILQIDANNKTHLIYVEGTSAVETKEIAVESQYDSDLANAQIKFGTQKETFDTAGSGITVYVNGSKYNATPYTAAAADTVIEGILKNAVGTIKLAKVPYTSGLSTLTPANYNTILVDVYQIAQVRSVEYLSGKTTVNISNCGSNNINKYDTIELSDNDIANDVKLKVTLDGEAIELKDLQKNDVIAVKVPTDASDVTTTATTKLTSAKKDITILVSRETVAGKVTAVEVEDSDNKFTVEGVDYASVDKDNVKLALNTSYNVIYLDPFGRIAQFNEEEVEETHNYAILAKLDDTDATLVLADGTKKTYEIKNTSVFPSSTAFAVDASGTGPAGLTVNRGEAAYDCVYDYTLKNGKINSMKKVDAVIATKGSFTLSGAGRVVPAAAPNAPDKDEYRAEAGKLGAISVNSTTNIIDVDAASYKDYTGLKVSQLSDGEKYEGYAFGKIKGTSIYALVVMTASGYRYSAKSRFAVLDTNAWSSGLDADGDTVDQLKVIVNGEKTTLNVDPTYKASLTISSNYRGRAFFYHTNTDGLVDEVRWITPAQIRGLSGGVTLAGAFGAGKYDAATNKWGTTLINGTEDARLVQGIVVGTGTNTVRMINIPTGAAAVDTTNFETLKLAEDCLIYTFNTKSDVEEKDRLNAKGVILASDFSDWKISVDPEATVEPFTDSNANGVYDAGVDPFDDLDNSGARNTIAAVYTANDVGKVAWGFTPSAGSTPAALANAYIEAQLRARGIKTNLASTLTGKTAEQKAQYALALVVDDQVVEIYEIIQ